MSHIVEKNSNNLEYNNSVSELFGVIVHVGTGEHGHYYSYVKQ